MIALSSASVKLVLFFMLIGGRMKDFGAFDVSEAKTESVDSSEEGGLTRPMPGPGAGLLLYCCCCCWAGYEPSPWLRAYDTSLPVRLPP